jgi:hypothetical protein
MAVTIARRVPLSRLKSVDFPTFGRPTRTTLEMRLGMNLEDVLTA